MNSTRCLIGPFLTTIAFVAAASAVHGATIPVTGWAAHNQSTPATVITNAGTNSPTFTPADQALTALGTFPNVALATDGDFIKASATLTMSARFGNTGANALNTQLRFGLYKGPDGPVGLEDVPNVGVFVVYANNVDAQDGNRRLRHMTSPTNINPFAGDATTNISDPGSDDVGADTIQGANTGPIYFELMMTRNAGNLDITAQISGTDSVSGNPYISNYSVTGYNPVNIGTVFNRAGFFFGNNVDAPSATLSDVVVTTNVPEPTSCLLAVAAVVGTALAKRRTGRRR